MQSSGSTSEQSRIYNERIILHLIRQHPEISRVQISKHTGLSAQTISVITSSLLERELLSVVGKVTGRRGQPSIKLSINPQGAYGLGINVDRNHISAALLDFTGAQVFLLERQVSFPTEHSAKSIAQDLLQEVKLTLGDHWSKVQGVGLAKPDYMDSWLDSLVTNPDQREDLGRLQTALAYWQSDAFEHWLSEQTGLPCYRQNDAAAAATSELLLAAQAPKNDFFYLFVSTACGGSLVANGECYSGANGKAGSFGLIPTATGRHGKWVLEALSLASLHRYLQQCDLAWPESSQVWQRTEWQNAVQQWAEEVAEEIKSALVSVVALYDPQSILLGGLLPAPVNLALIDSLASVLKRETLLTPPPICMAQTGHIAGVLGAAVLPLYETFAPQQNLLLLSSKR